MEGPPFPLCETLALHSKETEVNTPECGSHSGAERNELLYRWGFLWAGGLGTPGWVSLEGSQGGPGDGVQRHGVGFSAAFSKPLK